MEAFSRAASRYRMPSYLIHWTPASCLARRWSPPSYDPAIAASRRAVIDATTAAAGGASLCTSKSSRTCPQIATASSTVRTLRICLANDSPVATTKRFQFVAARYKSGSEGARASASTPNCARTIGATNTDSNWIRAFRAKPKTPQGTPYSLTSRWFRFRRSCDRFNFGRKQIALPQLWGEKVVIEGLTGCRHGSGAKCNTPHLQRMQDPKDHHRFADTKKSPFELGLCINIALPARVFNCCPH